MGETKKKEETEFKFLVKSDAWRAGASGTLFRQGYLSTDPERTVRVRLEGNDGKLTIKGKKIGATAPEFEYNIPADDVNFILDHLCAGNLIEKTRYKVNFKGLTWEIDDFHGVNKGLVVAELELKDSAQTFEKPEWVGQEVTKDFRYTNARLSEHPFGQWNKKE